MINKSTLTFYTFILSICISICSISNSFSQENNIFELKTHNTESKTSSKLKSDKKDNNNREVFNNLAYNLHPSIFIENGIEKTVYGDGLPIKLIFEDVNSLKTFSLNNEKFNEVQILTIKINSLSDLSNHYDFSEKPELKNLKFIFIKSNIKCNPEQLKQFIKTNSETQVFYTINRPS
ncbi:hypothetical protein [Thalassobellus citreus]|uniref:hypothetical protein n=1 Tax=Thalassobellus citreus TaxID=3367752 RepID=UPI0037AB8331